MNTPAINVYMLACHNRRILSICLLCLYYRMRSNFGHGKFLEISRMTLYCRFPQIGGRRHLGFSKGGVFSIREQWEWPLWFHCKISKYERAYTLMSYICIPNLVEISNQIPCCIIFTVSAPPTSWECVQVNNRPHTKTVVRRLPTHSVVEIQCSELNYSNILAAI